MAVKKFGLKFDGVAELSERLDKLGGDLKAVTEEALAFIPAEINPKLHAAIAKHNKPGKVAESIVEDQKVTWLGSVARIPVGFDFKKGGLPSIFLMYGTPRHAPRNQYGGASKPGAREHPGTVADRELYEAIYGKRVQADIAKTQQKIFSDAIAQLIK